jgi:hypothetical protein
VKTIFGANALVNNIEGSLDYINTSSYTSADSLLAIVIIPNVDVYFYHWESSNEAVASSPDIIQPRVGAGRWIKDGGSAFIEVKELDTGGTLTSADIGKLIIINSNGNQNINLPATSGLPVGSKLTFEKIGTGRLTLTTNGSNIINNSSAGGTIYCSDSGMARLEVYLVTSNIWHGNGNNTWTTT